MATELDPTSPHPASATPGILPDHEVVILRERELDCDVATAIARVRADPETARARILVVDEDDTPPEASSSPASWAAPPGQMVRRAERHGASAIGHRTQPLVRCVMRHLEEADAVLADGPAADPRAWERLASLLRWAREGTADLAAEADAAAAGWVPVATRDLAIEMAGAAEARFPGLRVTVATSDEWPYCRGRPDELAEVFFLAIGLVASRIGGRGGVAMALSRDAGWARFRVLGTGEPRPLEAPALVVRFRQLVAAHGGAIEQDQLGAHGAGLIVRLPADTGFPDPD